MASDLKWRLGFGWSPVFLAGTGLVLLLSAGGVWRALGGLIALISGGWVLFQYYKWNSSPWRKIHFRGMLLYSRILGSHAALVGTEQGPVDKVAACRELALAVVGQGKEANVDAMIGALEQEEGVYLAQLLRAHAGTLFEGTDPSKLDGLLTEVEQLKFGPVLVICNIVENTYGAEEAARYARAICSGQAY